MNRRVTIAILTLGLLAGFALSNLNGGAQASRRATAATPSTITVTSTEYDGPGSLRQAVADASPGDTINFAVTGYIPTPDLTIDKDLTIQGPGANLLAFYGGYGGSVISVGNGATVTLNGVTIRAGYAVQGAGIMNRGTMTINNCVIRENYASQGAGVQNDGTMTINNSTIQDNEADDNLGGGIIAYGPLTVNNSLITTNYSGPGGGGIAADGIGGGNNPDGITLKIINSTIMSNFTNGSGPGILLLGGVSATIINATIVENNTVFFSGGGIRVDNPERTSVNLRNTIVARNFMGNGTASDISGPGIDPSSSYNLIGTGGSGGLTDGVNNNQVGVADPKLGALADKGGPTQVRPLLADSPAIDKGGPAVDPTTGLPVATDQRGRPRPFDQPSVANVPGGNGSDIGAFETGANTAPSVAAFGVARTAGDPYPLNSVLIARVNDNEESLEKMLVTVNGGASATVGGVTVSDIYISPAGYVSAKVIAQPCAAAYASFTLRVTDGFGTFAETALNVTVATETTPPLLSCPSDIVVNLPPNSMDTGVVVNYPAPTATDNCTASPTITTSKPSGSVFPVGTTTVTVTAKDAALNQSTCSFTVTVRYNFTGFFQPITNLPTVNVVNAGKAVPVKFSLGGNKGLNIFAPGYPASQQVACDSGAPVSEVQETSTAGNSSLSYDAGSGTYNYVWKTESAWQNTCRKLIVKLNDGTTHEASFRFR